MSVYVGFKLGKATKHHAYISEYYCGGCGYPVSDHDSYCPECGGAFRKEDATERTCSPVWKPNEWGFANAYCECGALLLRVANGLGESLPHYCPNCGAKVVS